MPRSPQIGNCILAVFNDEQRHVAFGQDLTDDAADAAMAYQHHMEQVERPWRFWSRYAPAPPPDQACAWRLSHRYALGIGTHGRPWIRLGHAKRSL